MLNNLFSPILLNEKRRKNRRALDKKTFTKVTLLIFLLHNSFEDVLLIFLFHNFFEDVFLIFLLYLLIVLPSFCFFVVELGVDVFSKDNIRKNKGDDLETKIQGDINRKNNPSTGIDINKKTRTNNFSIKIDTDVGINKRTKENNLGTRMDTDIRANR